MIVRSSERLRVLIVPHLSEKSGAPFFAALLAGGLDPKRFHTRLLFPGPGVLVDYARAKGLEFAESALMPSTFGQAAARGERAAWLVSRLRYIRDCNAQLREFRPDVVYVHSIVQTIPGWMARMRRIPVVWHVQEFLDAPLPQMLRRARHIRKMSSAIVFCAHASKKMWGEPPAGRLWRVAPNALFDESAAAPRPRAEVRRELGIPESATLLVCVGGVQYRKGMDVLLDAFARVRRQPEGADAWLILAGSRDAGSGTVEFNRRLDAFVRENNLADRVQFLGHRDNVADYLGASDLYVLASRNEALPLAALEAFAVGIPAVLTDTGDCARLAEGERCALCVPCNDAAALAGALSALLRDPERRRRMGREARELVAREYRFDSMTRNVGAILEMAAGRRPAE